MAKDLDLRYAIARTRNWLEDCVEKYPACIISAITHLPKRVDVVFEGCIPQLVESNGEIAPYAALSYCWGRSGHLKTIKDTSQERTVAISWDILPKIYKDAFLFARELGLQYL